MHITKMDWSADLLKSTGAFFDLTPRKNIEGMPKATMIHPDRLLRSIGIGLEKPTLVTFRTLRMLAERCPVIGAIINTRQNQIANFCARPKRPTTPGFRVILSDRERKATDEDKERCREVEEIFLNMHKRSGIEERFVRGIHFPEGGFDAFVRTLIRDLLTLDAMCFEKVNTGDGKLFTMWPVDAATIYPIPNEYHLVTDDRENRNLTTLERLVAEKEKLFGNDRARAVRWIQKLSRGAEKYVADFTPDELYYGFMNPRSDLEKIGYGYSPLEQMIIIVTGILFSLQYNNNAFSQGTLTPGLLQLSGNYDKEMMEDFKLKWEQQLTGILNSGRVPLIINADDQGKGKAEFLKFKDSNRDMEFNQYLEFLANVACALYNMAPEEINFKTHGRPQTSLGDRGPKEEIEAGQDKGLRPLLTFLANVFTEEIVKPIYDDLEFEFINLTKEDAKMVLETRKAERDLGLKTVNDLRKEDDTELVPPEELWGDAPTDPQLLQVYLQGSKSFVKAQSEAQAEAGGGMEGFGEMGGMPPEEGTPPEPEAEDVTHLMTPEGGGEDVTSQFVRKSLPKIERLVEVDIE